MVTTKKKILTIVGVVAIAAGMVFSFNFQRTNDADLQINVANAEALADGVREMARFEESGDMSGGFPMCQKGQGTAGEKKIIPLCNAQNKCVNTIAVPMKLNTNDCVTVRK